MNNVEDTDLIEFGDTLKNQDFAVSITDLLRCARIAQERFMVPPVDQTGRKATPDLDS